MRHKTPEMQSDWDNFKSTYEDQAKMLKWYATALDNLSQLLGWGELFVTDFLRRDKKYTTSYHYVGYGLALDFRVKERPLQFYWFMIAVGKLVESINPKIRMQPHWELYGKPQQHIHIEIRLR